VRNKKSIITPSHVDAAVVCTHTAFCYYSIALSTLVKRKCAPISGKGPKRGDGLCLNNCQLKLLGRRT